MVDKLIVESLLNNLRDYICALRRLGSIRDAELLADQDKLASVKYHFIVSIERCVDIANHIIASENFNIPKDNAESLAELCRRGIVPADIQAQLQAMARFRNRLVHMYWKVDDGLVLEYLHNRLQDLERFVAAVAGYCTPAGG